VYRTITGGRQDHERAYYFSHGGTHAVIKGDWKAFRRRNRPWQLYNTAKDKTEMTNLAAEMPEKVKQLADLWEARFGTKDGK
jgi:arylsulfatase